MAKVLTMRSAFCVINNPEYNIIYELNEDNEPIIKPDGTKVVKEKIPTEYHGMSPEEICDAVLNKWVQSKEGRTGAVSYCVSVAGLHHLHCVFECSRNDKFALSVLKKLFPKIHAESTRGSKQQAEDYINKKGSYAEKGETVLCVKQVGEIQGRQGNRSDLSAVDEMIKAGKTPAEIFDSNICFRRYDKIVKSAYISKRLKETPMKRDVTFYWHVGESGTGKTYTYLDLCEKYGEDNVFLISDYGFGMYDRYIGQPVLFLDEFKGQISYSTLLVMFNGLKQELRTRYENVYTLWNEVHIASIFPPEVIYKMLCNSEFKDIDSYEQLKRRISFVVYHFKDDTGYHEYTISGEDYVDYKDLVWRSKCDNVVITDDLPFKDDNERGEENEDNQQYSFDI